MKHLLIIAAFAVLALASCRRHVEFAGPEPGAQVVIKNGTFYGMCAGYCLTETIIRDAGISYRESSHEPGKFPDKNKSLTITGDEWRDLTGAVDMGALMALDSIIGCPDCADGGGEWIEVRKGEQTRRIVFQHGASIAPIAGLLEKVRAMRARASL